MPSLSTRQLSDLVEEQRNYFREGHTRSIPLRLAHLKSFQTALEEARDEILTALEKDLAKPHLESFLAEYYFLLDEVRLMQRKLSRWLKPQRTGNPIYFWPCRSRIEWEPQGCVLIISPWNYPFQLALSPMIAALAAGNTVLLKPSEYSPATSAIIQQLIAKCFPPQLVSLVEGDAEFTNRLLDERFDFLCFTGSTRVGKIVAEKAAQHLTPTILELGGKCPCIVEQSADLAMTARRILVGKLFNAGQTCFAPDFVAVHRDQKAALTKELERCLEEHPWEREMARIIHREHLDHLQSLVQGDVFQKGEDDLAQLHFAPRLLRDADWESPAMRDEVFGPLLPIVSYQDEDDLVRRLASLSTPLALYLFSRDTKFTQRILKRIPSGGVCLNDVAKHATNLQLPFGGKGESGHGRYRGQHGVYAFSFQRAVTKRYFFPDPFESLPPRDRQFAMLKKWMR